MRRIVRHAVLLFIASGVLFALGCGDAEIGEECEGVGSTEDCEDGAICTNEETGAVCRALCADTTQCPPAHTCNGVSGTNLKSCQPDKLKPPA
jgi:hypothetical protein